MTTRIPWAAVAGLALACSAPRAERRGAEEQRSGAGTDAAEVNERAVSTQPTQGAGGQNPHPLPTAEGGGERYGGDRAAAEGAQVPEPGLTGRPGHPTAAERSAAAAQADAPAQPAPEEVPEVAGRVASVSGDELRIRTDDGGEERLRTDAQTLVDVDGRQAQLADLPPGAEVRASYEEKGGEKSAVAVHARTGAAPGAASPGATVHGTAAPPPTTGAGASTATDPALRAPDVSPRDTTAK
jgi:hypothetical protein